ncbi:PglL family O-oligosaccharyltransferase [Ralstonia chuxiongensis]|uniref:Wzy polymerase domain-containing protein n=1 Tax=Ralstonia chuxiongensis TaxID=2957504 RepID=A0AA41WSC3_9RALS|nr:O-antigen ligase family protein [Ralstonia chuxiongensis]MCP1172432.1 Wzy polymerase domain-containing protein [Ralstonia chuxiongensis]
MRRFSVLHLLAWLALGSCWVIPFLVAPHTYPIPTFYSEWVAAACWIALGVAVLGATWGRAIGLPRVALAPLALVAVLIVQLAIAPPLNPFFSSGAIAALLAAAVICGLGARCRDLPGVLDAIAVAVTVGGLLTVAIELLQLFRVPNLPEAFFSMTPTGGARRMWGNLNQPNHVGSYLAFGLAACLFLGNRHRKWLGLLMVAVLTLLFGMALTFSRVTWIHIAVVGLLAGMPLAAETRGRAWSVRLLALCGPVVLLALTYQACGSVVALANGAWNLDLPGSMGQRMQEGVGLRPLLWKHAWHIFLSHPWLGGGWGDYAWNQYVQTDTVGPVEMSMNAHNIVLDLLAKVGVAGLLAVLIPLAWWALGLLKRLRSPDVAFLCAVVAVMVVHSLLEYPLHYVFFLFPFAFVLGLLDSKTLRFPSPSIAWVFSGVIVVLGGVLLVRLWADYRSVERLYFVPGARSASAGHLDGGPVLLAPYATLVVAMNASVNEQTAPLLVKLERQAVQFYPASATIQRYALALAFEGKNEEAVVQIRRLHSHYWTDFSAQSLLLSQTCQRNFSSLKTFCSSLKSEKLLANAD